MEMRETQERYYAAIRNLSQEQIRMIEAGECCMSDHMRYAQQCYYEFVAAEQSVCSRSALDVR